MYFSYFIEIMNIIFFSCGYSLGYLFLVACQTEQTKTHAVADTRSRWTASLYPSQLLLGWQMALSVLPRPAVMEDGDHFTISDARVVWDTWPVPAASLRNIVAIMLSKERTPTPMATMRLRLGSPQDGHSASGWSAVSAVRPSEWKIKYT